MKNENKMGIGDWGLPSASGIRESGRGVLVCLALTSSPSEHEKSPRRIFSLEGSSDFPFSLSIPYHAGRGEGKVKKGEVKVKFGEVEVKFGEVPTAAPLFSRLWYGAAMPTALTHPYHRR